jgi:hypothetical protein
MICACAPAKTEMVACPPQGCAPPEDKTDPGERDVRRQAAFDLQCDKDKLEVTELSDAWTTPASWGARGCGRQASYLNRDGVVVLNSPVQTVRN